MVRELEQQRFQYKYHYCNGYILMLGITVNGP